MTSVPSAGAGDQPRVGRVDEHRLVVDVLVALGRRVHLLLEHPLVDGRDRPLRAAVDLALHRLGRAEGVLGHGAARRAGDPLGAEGDLVGRALVALAPLLGAVGVLDGHAHDRRSGCGRRRSASTPGIRRPVRTMTLPSTSSRRMRLGEPTSSLPSGVIVAALSPKPALAHRRGRLVDDLVVGLAPVVEGEIVAVELELEAEDLGVEHPEGLLEQLLPGLVALEDRDRQRFRHARTHDTTGNVAADERPQCSWCGVGVDADDGFRAAEPEGERLRRRSAASSTSCPGRSRAPHWDAGTLPDGVARGPRPRASAPTAASRPGTAACCSCATAASTGSPTPSARSSTSAPGRAPGAAGARRLGGRAAAERALPGPGDRRRDQGGAHRDEEARVGAVVLDDPAAEGRAERGAADVGRDAPRRTSRSRCPAGRPGRSARSRRRSRGPGRGRRARSARRAPRGRWPARAGARPTAKAVAKSA